MRRIQRVAGKYGPYGFTQDKAIQEIFSKYELKPGGWFKELKSEDLIKLSKLVPKEHMKVQHNFTPTFAEWIKLAKKFPELTFDGCVIYSAKGRDDESISISSCGAFFTEELLKELEKHEPDDLKVEKRDNKDYLTAWWD